MPEPIHTRQPEGQEPSSGGDPAIFKRSDTAYPLSFAQIKHEVEVEYHRGNFSLAIEKARQLLASSENYFGPDHPESIKTTVQIAQIGLLCGTAPTLRPIVERAWQRLIAAQRYLEDGMMPYRRTQNLLKAEIADLMISLSFEEDVSPNNRNRGQEIYLAKRWLAEAEKARVSDAEHRVDPALVKIEQVKQQERRAFVELQSGNILAAKSQSAAAIINFNKLTELSPESQQVKLRALEIAFFCASHLREVSSMQTHAAQMKELATHLFGASEPWHPQILWARVLASEAKIAKQGRVPEFDAEVEQTLRRAVNQSDDFLPCRTYAQAVYLSWVTQHSSQLNGLLSTAKNDDYSLVVRCYRELRRTLHNPQAGLSLEIRHRALTQVILFADAAPGLLGSSSEPFRENARRDLELFRAYSTPRQHELVAEAKRFHQAEYLAVEAIHEWNLDHKQAAIEKIQSAVKLVAEAMQDAPSHAQVYFLHLANIWADLAISKVPSYQRSNIQRMRDQLRSQLAKCQAKLRPPA